MQQQETASLVRECRQAMLCNLVALRQGLASPMSTNTHHMTYTLFEGCSGARAQCAGVPGQT